MVIESGREEGWRKWREEKVLGGAVGLTWPIFAPSLCGDSIFWFQDLLALIGFAVLLSADVSLSWGPTYLVLRLRHLCRRIEDVSVDPAEEPQGPQGLDFAINKHASPNLSSNGGTARRMKQVVPPSKDEITKWIAQVKSRLFVSLDFGYSIATRKRATRWRLHTT